MLRLINYLFQNGKIICVGCIYVLANCFRNKGLNLGYLEYRKKILLKPCQSETRGKTRANHFELCKSTCADSRLKICTAQLFALISEGSKRLAHIAYCINNVIYVIIFYYVATPNDMAET